MAFYVIKYRHERKIMMPLLPGSICIAWELTALIFSGGMWKHVLWFSLDLAVFTLNLLNIGKIRNRILYIVVTLFFIIVLAGCSWKLGLDVMLFSSFILDLFIAISYVVASKTISPRGKTAIAVAKFIGDIAAWQYYQQYSILIWIIGAIVFLLNLYYIAICLDESAKKNKPKRVRR